jgi:hypothetical protein
MDPDASCRSVLKVVIASVLLAGASPWCRGQGSAEYVPDKVYVIRVGPFCTDRAAAEATRDTIEAQLEQAYGILEQVKPKLYTVMRVADRQWFLAYFDPTRQTKEELLRDNYMFNWVFHDHNVQIFPLEQLTIPGKSGDLGYMRH